MAPTSFDEDFLVQKKYQKSREEISRQMPESEY